MCTKSIPGKKIICHKKIKIKGNVFSKIREKVTTFNRKKVNEGNKSLKQKQQIFWFKR